MNKIHTLYFTTLKKTNILTVKGLMLLIGLSLSYANSYQLTLTGGYGFSSSENYMGTGYSKPAIVDSAQQILFTDYWGTLGNGSKLNLSVSNFISQNIGIEIGGGVSLSGVTKINKTNGSINYYNQYSASYAYYYIGPKLRGSLNRYTLYSTIAISYFRPYNVEYIDRYYYSDKYMNLNSDNLVIHSNTYKLYYSNGWGTIMFLGVEYKLTRFVGINLEGAANYFNSIHQNKIISWYATPDQSTFSWGKNPGSTLPTLFNNYALKIGLSWHYK